MPSKEIFDKFKKGSLKSGSGQKVTNPFQAKAIAASYGKGGDKKKHGPPSALKKAMGAMALLFAIGVGKAHAYTEVQEVAKDSWTVTSVSVSSSAATQMDVTGTNLLTGRFSIEIQNQSSSANMFCGQSSGAISRTSGRKIAPGASWTLALKSHDQASARLTIYCINDGTAASTASVTQLK